MTNNSNHPRRDVATHQVFECICTLECDSAAVKSLVSSQNGQLIVSVSNDNTIKAWNFRTEQVVTSPDKNYNHSEFEFVVLTPSGSKFVVCSYETEDYTIAVWDWHAEQEIYTSQMDSYSLQYEWDHENLYIPKIESVKISPGGKAMVINYDYQDLKHDDSVCSLSEVVSLETGYVVTLNGHSHDVSWAISADNQTIISGSDDNSIKVWEKTYNNRGNIKACLNNSYGYNSLRPGQEVCTDDIMRDLDFQTVQLSRTLKGHSDKVTSLAVSANNQTIVSGSQDGIIKVWNCQTGENIHTLKGHLDGVFSLAVSEDGKILVSGGEDQTIKVWNCQTGEMLQSIEGWSVIEFEVKSVCLSPDAQTIFSQGDDNTIKVWAARTSDEERIINGTNLSDEIDTVNQVNALHLARERLDTILKAVDVANQLNCMDESMKQALKYQIRQIIWKDINQPYLPSNWRTSDRAMYLGYSPNRAQSIAIGKQAAKLYREKYNEEPPQSEQVAYGETRLINVYSGKAVDLLDTAIRQVMET